MRRHPADGFKDTAPYIVLLVMLAVRPQGCSA